MPVVCGCGLIVGVVTCREALGRCARQDGSVHASDMYTLVHEVW